MKRIGILTSGGDCQGLNASIRGVAKSLYEEFGNDVEIYGIKDGYKGLIFGEYKLMKPEDFSGILTLGGTILGTSRQPFKLMRVMDKLGVDAEKAIEEIKTVDRSRKNYHNYYCETKWGDARGYDMTIKSDVLGCEETAKMLIAYIRSFMEQE